MSDFSSIRANIIGEGQMFDTPYGPRRMLYADWTATGRLYRPIEEFIAEQLGPFVGNTHTETSITGKWMTEAYHQAQEIIKAHVHADDGDALMLAGFGMTAAINKLQRMLGLRIPERCCQHAVAQQQMPKPLVILSHMEHHSNHITWNECCCDVVILKPDANGLPDLTHLEQVLQEHQDRKVKIGSFTACSNVTGILPPYPRMAELMHRYGGMCFVDFSASAPYLPIDMHPASPLQKLDAIFFSPHKFLGGPGSSGVLVMDKALYKIKAPDQPGGGTVLWTNPWREQRYFSDIEVREDGGTPGFLQAIRAALAIRLKESMGTEAIQEREHRYGSLLIDLLQANPEIEIMEAQQRNRLGIVSFYSRGRHHNLVAKLLNDRFGIQVRGGCSCAGTYGHILLNVDRDMSQAITGLIDQGDLSTKPGWVRISLHPTMTEDEVRFIAQSVHDVMDHWEDWAQDYVFDASTAEFFHKEFKPRFPDLQTALPD